MLALHQSKWRNVGGECVCMQKIELCFWWEHWNKKNKNKLVLVKSITCTAVLVVSYSHCPLCLFDLNSGLPGNQFCNFGYIYLFDSSDIRVPLMWTQEDHNKTKAGIIILIIIIFATILKSFLQFFWYDWSFNLSHFITLDTFKYISS